MNYEQITKTVKSTLVFVKNFVKDQLGAMVMFVALIIAAVAWGEYKHTRGKDESSDRISELEKRIEYRNKRIESDSAKILKLEIKIDTLQTKIAMRDCTEEVIKYKKLLDYFAASEAEKTAAMNQRLKQIQNKAKTLEKTLKL